MLVGGLGSSPNTSWFPEHHQEKRLKSSYWAFNGCDPKSNKQKKILNTEMKYHMLQLSVLCLFYHFNWITRFYNTMNYTFTHTLFQHMRYLYMCYSKKKIPNFPPSVSQGPLPFPYKLHGTKFPVPWLVICCSFGCLMFSYYASLYLTYENCFFLFIGKVEIPTHIDE